MTNLLPSAGIAYTLMIFFLAVFSLVIVTFRLIMVVRGYRVISTLLTSLHALVMVLVLGAIFTQFDVMWNIIAYALGVGSGNLLGIYLEEKIAIGYAEVRIITTDPVSQLASSLRHHGYGATETYGHGASGPVHVIHSIVRRRDIPKIKDLSLGQDPHCFITVDDVKPMRKSVWPA